MSDVKHTPDRYTVKCLGSGGFVVVDLHDDSEWGLTMWRDVADKLARRWNLDDRAAIARCTPPASQGEK